jgi:hypothetical protein
MNEKVLMQVIGFIQRIQQMMAEIEEWRIDNESCDQRHTAMVITKLEEAELLAQRMMLAEAAPQNRPQQAREGITTMGTERTFEKETNYRMELISTLANVIEMAALAGDHAKIRITLDRIIELAGGDE